MEFEPVATGVLFLRCGAVHVRDTLLGKDLERITLWVAGSPNHTGMVKLGSPVFMEPCMRECSRENHTTDCEVVDADTGLWDGVDKAEHDQHLLNDSRSLGAPSTRRVRDFSLTFPISIEHGILAQLEQIRRPRKNGVPSYCQ